VIDVSRHAARQEWAGRPVLYALVSREALAAADAELPPEVWQAPAGSLIPLEQEPLEYGEPDQVLARIKWPDEVAGCVLVTDVVALPEAVKRDPPSELALAEDWARTHAEGHQAQLAVGVLRDGHYMCGLWRLGEQEIEVRPDLADDLIAALLGTF
jgi:hypothetical protein